MQRAANAALALLPGEGVRLSSPAGSDSSRADALPREPAKHGRRLPSHNQPCSMAPSLARPDGRSMGFVTTRRGAADQAVTLLTPRAEFRPDTSPPRDADLQFVATVAHGRDA